MKISRRKFFAAFGLAATATLLPLAPAARGVRRRLGYRRVAERAVSPAVANLRQKTLRYYSGYDTLEIKETDIFRAAAFPHQPN